MPGPLEGIRVADFTWVWAGPTCTLQLAHMGAEVIRMESTRRVCALRMLPPWPDGQPGPNRSGYFNQYNQGKRSILLDISKPEGAEIAKQDRRHERCRRRELRRRHHRPPRPRLRGAAQDQARPRHDQHVRLRPDGGPRRGFVSYGPAQVPLSGLSQLTGYAGWPPMHVGMSYGDPNAGLHAAFAVLSALVYRERTGEGQYIDMSQWESTMSPSATAFMDYTMNGEQPPRIGNRVANMAPHGVFRCARRTSRDGFPPTTLDQHRLRHRRRVAGALRASWSAPNSPTTPRFRTLADRKANEDDLESRDHAWTLTQDPLRGHASAPGRRRRRLPPLMNKELAEDPHLAARNFFVEKEHPEVGVRMHAGIPWRMSDTPCEVWRAAPVMGQDNDYVFGELLGYSSDQIADLVAARSHPLMGELHALPGSPPSCSRNVCANRTNHRGTWPPRTRTGPVARSRSRAPAATPLAAHPHRKRWLDQPAASRTPLREAPVRTGVPAICRRPEPPTRCARSRPVRRQERTRRQATRRAILRCPTSQHQRLREQLPHGRTSGRRRIEQTSR